MVDQYQGKTAAEWSALGKQGKARAASRGGQTGKEWTGSGADPYDRSAIQTQIQGDAALRQTAQETQQYKDWTGGASGFTDIYREGKAGEITGPEYHLGKSGDVDIHGYPDDWAIRRTDEGEYITPTTGSWAGKEYFKPTDSGGGGGNGDQPSTGGGNDLVDSSALQQMNITELTDDMSIFGMLEKVMRQDSPLYRAAITRGMQDMARRGMYNVNTTLVADAIQGQMNQVMASLVKDEVGILTDNLYYNAEWGQKEIAAANAYVRQRLLNKLQNAATLQLQEITNTGLYAQKMLGETGATDRQRMETYADIMGQTYGKADQPEAQYWEDWLKLFGSEEQKKALA